MSIPYRTRRRINAIGMIVFIVAAVLAVAWLCWIVWLQRYVVYVDGGAKLDFQVSANDLVGEIARPQSGEALGTVEIFYNEGADAIDTGKELTQISGYYITSEMFQKDMPNVQLQVERLPSGTAMMIDMKGPYGSFFYNSKLADAVISQSTDVNAVETLVKRMQAKGFYTIARISSLRDRSYGDTHVTSGLYMLSRAGLWMDKDGMFWLDPTQASTTSWISSVVLELKNMGFNEVVLTDFRFPNNTEYIFKEDKLEALNMAANTINTACASDDFVLSFCTDDPALKLPSERSRLYLENVDATRLEQYEQKVDFENVDERLLFLCDSGDTRYERYSVLRSLNVAEEVEARKAG